MRKLTDAEKQFLETLYKDTSLEGRGALRCFIIRNTYEPKYKIGDFVKVSDFTGHYIYGLPVRGINMKIEEINWWLKDKGEECVQYCGTARDQYGKEFYIVAEESIHGKYTSRHVDGPSDTDMNELKKKSDVEQSCSVDF